MKGIAMTSRYRCSGVLGAAVVLMSSIWLPGCLDRTEVIVVSKDGHVRVTHEWKGSKSDVEGGAAARPEAAIWNTTTSVGSAEESKLSAWAEFGSMSEVPMNFADADPSLTPAQLSWTTTLDTERIGNVVRRTFRRTYRRFDWSGVAESRRQALTKEIEKLFEKAPKKIDGSTAGEGATTRPAEFSIEDEAQLIRTLIEYERLKSRIFAEAAVAAIVRPKPMTNTARDRAETTVDAFFSRNVSVESAAALLKLEAAEIETRVKELERQLDAELVDNLSEVVVATPKERAAIALGLARARRAFAVAEDLSDEEFKIELTLPGRIVMHDGELRGASTVKWKFNGGELRNEAVTLTAISESEE